MYNFLSAKKKNWKNDEYWLWKYRPGSCIFQSELQVKVNSEFKNKFLADLDNSW